MKNLYNDIRGLPKNDIFDSKTRTTYHPVSLLAKVGGAILFTAIATGCGFTRTVLLKELFPANRFCGHLRFRRDNDDVIIPVTSETNATLDRLRADFISEITARNMSQGFHSIITAKSYFTGENGNSYLLMDFEGYGVTLEDLHNWLRVHEDWVLENTRERFINMRAWACLFRNLTDNVRIMHSAGMIHSGICPATIVIRSDIEDPGRIYEEIVEKLASSGTDSGGRFSHCDVMLLNPGILYDNAKIDKYGDLCAQKRRHIPFAEGYASPELTGREDTVTQFSDVYSLGRCFLYCVGKLSHAGYIFPSDDLTDSVVEYAEQLFDLTSNDKILNEYTKIRSASTLSEMINELIDRLDAEVSKAAIWEAARKDFMKKRSGAGIFSGIDLVEDILPLGEVKTYNKACTTESKKQAGILELISNHCNEHIYIWGDGGIGKTTSFVKIMHDEYATGSYDATHTVPIFIELNHYVGVSGVQTESGKTHFIVNYIRHLLTGMAVSAKSNSVSNEIYSLFSAKKKEPEYLLLLDGINEVSLHDGGGKCSALPHLFDEIHNLTCNCCNVRVILTGRDDYISFSNTEPHMFTSIKLSGVSESTVSKYLELRGKVEPLVATENGILLMRLLRNPLYLTMLAGWQDDKIPTPGSLLKSFWLGNDQNFYSQPSIYQRYAKNGTNALSLESYWFIINFILPTLCVEMERQDRFELSEHEIRELVDSILHDNGDSGFLSSAGDACFAPYFRELSANGESRISAIAHNLALSLNNRLTDLDGEVIKDSIPAWSRIANELTEAVSVLYRTAVPDTSGSFRIVYGIKHHYLRDFFAAVYWIQKMRLACYVHSSGADCEE